MTNTETEFDKIFTFMLRVYCHPGPKAAYYRLIQTGWPWIINENFHVLDDRKNIVYKFIGV